MYRLADTLNTNGQEEDSTCKAVELNIQVLEERITPGVWINRSEMLIVEQTRAERDVELDIQVLEERMAPGLQINRTETLIADTSARSE